MNTKRITIIVVAVTLATLLASGNPALAWDVQEKIQNNTGQDVYDLTKIVEFVETGVVINAIENQLGKPNISPHTPSSGGPAKWIIHWGENPQGLPPDQRPSVPPDEWVWACFNASGTPKKASAFWTDEDGNKKPEPPPPIEVYVSESRDQQDNVLVDVEHSWRDWTGTGWPPSPDDDFGDPLGPITGTDVYFGIIDVNRPLEELNEDLYDDPDITWEQLDDFQLDSVGDTASYNLGKVSNSDFVILRFVASDEGTQTETITIHQFQPSPPTRIPTVSQWGLIIMAMLLVTVGMIVIVRRRRQVVA